MKDSFDQMYDQGLAKWTREQPPSKLVELIKSGKIPTGQALDVGCGEGYYSNYLSAQGFKVTGIDFSEVAIARAKAKFPEINFQRMDIANDDLSGLGEFDFVLEWALRHNLSLNDQDSYNNKLAQITKSGAIYLLTNFSIHSTKFGEPGERERCSKTSFPMWFMPLDEQIQKLEPFYEVLEAKDDFRLGKHRADYLLMRKKFF